MTPNEEIAMMNKLDKLIEKVTGLQEEKAKLENIVDLQEQIIGSLKRSIEHQTLSIKIQRETIDNYKDATNTYKKHIKELNELIDIYSKENENLLYEITELYARLNKKSWWQFWK